MPHGPETPPRASNHEGAPRRVGVEIEFAAVSAGAAAGLVQELFGGELSQIDPHRFEIRGSELGDFRCELDTQYVHAPKGRLAETFDQSPLFREFREAAQELLGDVSALVVPCEIVCPPVAIERLTAIDDIVTALRRAGARGTRDNILFAFGAQLNPDIADDGVDYIASVLKAYLLLSDWLREQISIDLTRRIFPFADRFPGDYVVLVTDPGYWPGVGQLIDDYLAYNPTRNRELDMLPLFAWLDEDRVAGTVPDPRIRKRPTFHYRLPNARVGERDWTIAEEWNRWCVVERLAEDAERLADMGRAYRENQESLFSGDWARRAGDWIVAS